MPLADVVQVYDEDGRNRTYGFVDYVTPEGAQMALQQKSILMPPGQYIKVSNNEYIEELDGVNCEGRMIDDVLKCRLPTALEDMTVISL